MRSRFARRAAACLLFSGAALSGAAQTSESPWIDRASLEYAVMPNVVYRTTSGVDLKLDVYQPPDRKAKTPVVMLIHVGGGAFPRLPERGEERTETELRRPLAEPY